MSKSISFKTSVIALKFPKKSLVTFSEIISLLPPQLLQFISWLLGLGTLLFMGKRRRLAINNLRGAFPCLGSLEILQTTIKSTCRTMEQGLLVLAWSRLKSKRLSKACYPLSQHGKYLVNPHQCKVG